MPILTKDTYRPPFWLKGGHFQTIYPSLFREVRGVSYYREQITLPDSDFLNLDWAYALNNTPSYPKQLVIISHGFEGDSHRQYVLGLVRAINKIGLDCLAWNFRSCGGEMNLQPRFYHSGATEDLDEVVQHALSKGYERIILSGFSLGGNLTLTYLGREKRTEIEKAVVFSVPLDLKACSLNIGKRGNRVYEKRFLNTLYGKVLAKEKDYPEIVSSAQWTEVNSVYSFDDVYTAPMHGFKNADDYYGKSSSGQYVGSIAVPTLVLNSCNDPMVPVSSLPIDAFTKSKSVFLNLTKQGGHCGYKQADLKDNIYWSEQEAIDFILNK